MLSLYPERRRIELTSDVQMLAKTTLRASEVKSIVEQTQGVRLRPQDVKNLRLKLKGASADSLVVESLLQQLKDGGGHASYSLDQDGSLSYLCFCTKEMLAMLERFPYVFLLDFTYKTNKYLMPLMTVMAIDNYGHGCPVLHAFVRNEDAEHIKEILRFMTTLFNSNQTTCFVIDKDFSEINAVRSVFPEARLNLCHFHISQAVLRHLKKLATSMASTVHDLFMTQVTTESLEEYRTLRTELEAIMPQDLVTYFTTNWWSCPERWATCFNVGTMKLDTTTTNHIESFHGKIKRTLRIEMGLGDNINFLISYTQELYHTFLDSTVLDSNMRRYKTTNPDADAVFAAGLSTFIAENILQELNLAKRVQYSVRLIEEDHYEVLYKDSIKRTTPTTCDCRFHQSMRLPCRHVFFLRTYLNLTVFQASLVHDMHFLGGANAGNTSGNITSTVSNVRPVNVSTQEARYRKASKLCQDITVYMSILGEDEFIDKYNYLSNLFRSWKDDGVDSTVTVETVNGLDGTVYYVPVSNVTSVVVPVNVDPSPLALASGQDADSRDPAHSTCVNDSLLSPLVASTSTVMEPVSSPAPLTPDTVIASTSTVMEPVSSPAPLMSDTVVASTSTSFGTVR